MFKMKENRIPLSKANKHTNKETIIDLDAPQSKSSMSITEGVQKYLSNKGKRKRNNTNKKGGVSARITYTTQSGIVFEELHNQISFTFWCDSATGELMSTQKGTYSRLLGEVCPNLVSGYNVVTFYLPMIA